MRRALPWLGLLLLAISFAWFVSLPPSAPRTTSPRQPLTRAGHPFTVVLDPGHGGEDSGAMVGEVLEKDLTLDVAQRAELLLRAAGFATILTRDSDRYVSLAERASLGNVAKDSVFVSIHFNDGERVMASGVETYYAARHSAHAGWWSWLPFLQPVEATPLVEKSERLAGCLQAALVEQTSAINRGVKTEQFYVIAHVRHPAVLVEGGFITNHSDLSKLATAEYRQQIARAISDGVLRFREAAGKNNSTLALAAARPE